MSSDTELLAISQEEAALKSSDIVNAVKLYVDQLYLGKNEANIVLADKIDEQNIYDIAVNAALFYKMEKDRTIAGCLDQFQRNGLVDAALSSSLFKHFYSFYNFVDITGVESSAYQEIRSSCLDLKDKSADGRIYIYEFLHYLGLIDIEDARNYGKIREALYEDIISSLADSGNEINKEIKRFFENSPLIEFTEEQKEEIINLYIDKQNISIERWGFKNLFLKQLVDFEQHYEINPSGKKRLYNSANNALRKERDSDTLNNFIYYFKNICKYFGNMPKKAEKNLMHYIVNLMSEDYLDSRDITRFLLAQETYKDISSDRPLDKLFLLDVEEDIGIDALIGLISKRDRSDGNGKYLLSAKTHKADIDVRQRMINQAMYIMGEAIYSKSTVDGKTVLEDYIKAFDIFFDKGDLKEPLKNVVIDYSVNESKIKKVHGIEETHYVNSWDTVLARMTKLKDIFGIDLVDKTEPIEDRQFDAVYFQNSVKRRILSELEGGDVDGIFFWKDNMGFDDVSDFENKFLKFYNSAEKDYGENRSDGFLYLAKKYERVFGKYPDEFFGGFQDKMVNVLNSLILCETDETFIPVKERYIAIHSILSDLGEADVELLPVLKAKISEINKNHPALSEEEIPEIFRDL
ncbi:hypothetical protein GQ472_04275 [archaeon]|nr:hypothetical protein [archaeon]